MHTDPDDRTPYRYSSDTANLLGGKLPVQGQLRLRSPRCSIRCGRTRQFLPVLRSVRHGTASLITVVPCSRFEVARWRQSDKPSSVTAGLCRVMLGAATISIEQEVRFSVCCEIVRVRLGRCEVDRYPSRTAPLRIQAEQQSSQPEPAPSPPSVTFRVRFPEMFTGRNLRPVKCDCARSGC